MKGAIAALALALALVPMSAQAQSGTQTGGTSGASWWSYLEVRKSFDGGKAETEPGSVGLVDPGRDTSAYWFIDAGLRLKPQEVFLNDAQTFEFFWSPNVEWHRMKAEPLNKQDARNKWGPGLNAELWFPSFTGTTLRTYVIGKVSLQRDEINDTTERSGSLVVGLFQPHARDPIGSGWEGGLRPGAELTHNGHRRLHYYPYVGFEHYRKLAIASKGTVVAPPFDGSLFLFRVQAEAYPFHQEIIPGRIPFSISLEYSYRRVLDDAGDLETRDLNLLALSGTWFLVSEQRVGIGLTFENGRAPATNFVDQRRAVLAVRFKL